jgi:hypothetical protein
MNENSRLGALRTFSNLRLFSKERGLDCEDGGVGLQNAVCGNCRIGMEPRGKSLLSRGECFVVETELPNVPQNCLDNHHLHGGVVHKKETDCWIKRN